MGDRLGIRGAVFFCLFMGKHCMYYQEVCSMKLSEKTGTSNYSMYLLLCLNDQAILLEYNTLKGVYQVRM